MWRTDNPIVIAGGGIGGLCAAIALQAHGIPVVVLERAAHATSIGAGISLWPNAVRGLDALSVGAAVRARSAHVHSSALRTSDGQTLSEVDVASLAARAGAPLLMIDRADLRDALVAALGPGVLRYGCELCRYDVNGDSVDVTLADDTAVVAAALVGADGVASSVRAQLFPGHQPHDHSVVALRAVVKSAALELGSAFEAWGDGMLFGAAPVPGSRVYWYAAARRDAIDMLEDRVGAWASPTPELVASTPAEARLRHTIRTVPTLRRWSAGRVALLGDAAHAMVPNLGQGGAQAIEDAIVLARALVDEPADVPRALAAYSRARRRRAVSVQRASYRMARLAMLRGVQARARNAVLRRAPAASRRRAVDKVVGCASLSP